MKARIVRWGWRELNPRGPSQNVTGPRFRLNLSAKGAVREINLNNKLKKRMKLILMIYSESEFLKINIFPNHFLLFFVQNSAIYLFHLYFNL